MKVNLSGEFHMGIFMWGSYNIPENYSSLTPIPIVVFLVHCNRSSEPEMV